VEHVNPPAMLEAATYNRGVVCRLDLDSFRLCGCVCVLGGPLIRPISVSGSVPVPTTATAISIAIAIAANMIMLAKFKDRNTRAADAVSCSEMGVVDFNLGARRRWC
jgi:hypothetical protein